MAARILEASNWTCWPELGGWADQDAYLVNDVMTYLRLSRRLRYEVKKGIDSMHEEMTEDLPSFSFGNE